MSGRSADVRVRWILDLVDKSTRPMLKADRDVRRSLEQTERAHKKAQTTATTAAQRSAAAALKATGAYGTEGRAVAEVADELGELNRAQARALATTNRALASQARLITSYNRTASAAGRASAAERTRLRTQEAMAGASKRLSGIGAGTTGAAGGAATAGVLGAAAAVRTFAGFEQQMDRVQAVSGATGKTLASMTDQAKQLGADTAFSAKDAADGMYQLATAGFQANKVMKIIPGTLALASASGVDLATAAELQASTLRGFGLRAGEAGRVADVLANTVNRSAVEMSDLGESMKYIAPVAKASGQSLEDMLAAVGLMGNVGIKGSQAGTTLRTALVRLTAPTEKSANALKDLGIKSENLRGPKGLKPLPQIMGMIAKGAQGMDKGTRNAALAAIFGREALSGMVAMVEKGPDALKRNIKALEHSEGTAKRTAKVMRSNVAGAWDQLTGSVETAAITLTTRFGPAIQDSLKGAAGAVNDLAKGLSGAGGPDRTVHRGPGGRVESVAAKPASDAERAGSRAREIIGQVGDVAARAGAIAAGAGAQLLEAFKPAEPFLKNVLLPLLGGIAKGVLGSVVGAFKTLTFVIKAVSTVLGAIGRVAAPLKPVFAGIGVAIGWIAGGPILKGVALIGKLGGVFKLVGLAANLARVPIRLMGAAVGGAFKLAGSLASKLRGPAVAAFGLLGKAAGGVAGVIRGAVGKIGGAVGSVIGAVRKPLASLAVNVYSLVRGAFLKGRDAITGLGGVFLRAGKGLVSKLVQGIKGIGGAVKGAFGSGLGFAGDIGRALADWLNKSTPLGDRVNLPSPLPDFTLPALRRGGRIRRFAEGGRVPIMAAGGELYVENGRASVIPGDPRSDSTLMLARPGAAVVTGSGQELMAGGASLAEALRYQAPHFAKGGRVHGGRYLSTAYGPPWGGINGGGVTATGVNLKAGQHRYGIAVDPSRIRLGSKVYVTPNPFGTGHPFEAFDTGSAIKGSRIDFYDWRGRLSQNAWGRRPVNVSASKGSAPTGERTAKLARMLGRSSIRGGLLGDAFERGRAAGELGVSRGQTLAEILQAQREARAPYTRSVTTPGIGSSSSSAAGGGRLGRMVAFAQRAAAKFPKYQYGGGHASFGGPYDCSGFVGAILHAGGFTNRTMTTDQLKTFGRGGNGKSITIGVRGSSGRAAHTMIRLGGRYFEAGSSGVGQRKGWSGSFPIHRHPKGFRAGGVVGAGALLELARSSEGRARLAAMPAEIVGQGLRAGGRVARFAGGGLVGSMVPGSGLLAQSLPGPRLSRAAHSASAWVAGSMAALDAALATAADLRVGNLRAQLERAVHRGGNAKTVQRVQAMLDLVDSELGRRVGKIQRNITRTADRRTTAASRLDRRNRVEGIDSGSSVGANRELELERGNEAASRTNADRLARAIAIAKKAKNRDLAAELTGQLAEVNDAIAESVTRQVELARDAVRAQAQERVDAATFGVDFSNAGGALLEATQRVRGNADTAGGMTERANAIRSNLIPALAGQRDALYAQAQTALSTGDLAGWRSGMLAATQASTDLANAMADAGDLMKQAAMKAAQDLVDAATHRENLADAGLTNLELTQKLAGTFDTGGQARADYIANTIQPAIQAELAALKAQQETAAGQGDKALADQIAEAIAAAQNDLLQAQLDAMEQTAANTAPRRFGGTLGFAWGGDTLTDTLVLSGNGF